MRVVKSWRGCEIFSLEVFKTQRDMALSQLIYLDFVEQGAGPLEEVLHSALNCDSVILL